MMDSVSKESVYYPIKEIAEFDNSCRVPTGFQAGGYEPLGCNVAVQTAQQDPDQPGGTLIFWIPLDIDWCMTIDRSPPIKQVEKPLKHLA